MLTGLRDIPVRLSARFFKADRADTSGLGIAFEL